MREELDFKMHAVIKGGVTTFSFYQEGRYILLHICNDSGLSFTSNQHLQWHQINVPSKVNSLNPFQMKLRRACMTVTLDCSIAEGGDVLTLL